MLHLPHGVRGAAACGLTAVLLTVPLLAAKWSRADADAFHTKLVQIATHGLAEKRPARRTTVLEREVNAYIAVHADLPPGVVDPEISILPDGRLSGRATVDLDAMRAKQQRGVLSPWAFLRGTTPVVAVGILRTGKGVGAFTLESASVGGIPVPKSVLQELVAYYSKSASNPTGINLESPFRLPANIQEIRTTEGRALVVQ